jgi:L-ornithine Nalpha-acyltransferase
MHCEIVNKINDTKIINEILELRNLNFRETYNKEINDNWNYYDQNSYHFIIYDNEKIVGYYRLRKFENNINDTLASELFDLSNFSCDSFAEISRACVHIDYRDGSVISLLWTNISSFLLTENIKYCIGCTSSINDSINLIHTFSYILNKNLVFKDLILPKNKIKIETKLDEDQIKKKSVTTLIRAYGKQGALFSPWPSLDEEWNTLDFFTVFNVKDLTKRFSKMG